MTSFAIYEFIGLILALPLSYAMARLAKRYSYATYKDEVDRLYSGIWNGEEADELNAWLKVYSIYVNKKALKKKKYVLTQIDSLNKQKFYSSTLVDEKGKLLNYSHTDKMDLD